MKKEVALLGGIIALVPAFFGLIDWLGKLTTHMQRTNILWTEDHITTALVLAVFGWMLLSYGVSGEEEEEE